MGSNQSTSSSTSISEILNTSITEHTQSTRDSLQQRLQMSQTQNIRVGDIDINGDCRFSVNQTMTAELSATLQALHNMSSDTISSISADVAQQLETRLTQVNEELNLGQSNEASSSSYTRNSIENAIRNTQEQMSETFMDMGAVMNQEQDIELGNIKCTGSGEIELNQTMVIDMFASQVSETLFSATSDNQALASAAQSITTSIEQKNKGVDVMASCVTSIIVIIIICACFIILPLMGGLSSGKDSGSSESSGSSGSSESSGSSRSSGKSGKTGFLELAFGGSKNVLHGGLGPLIGIGFKVVCGIICIIVVMSLAKWIWENIGCMFKNDSQVFDEQTMPEDHEEKNNCCLGWECVDDE